MMQPSRLYESKVRPGCQLRERLAYWLGQGRISEQVHPSNSDVRPNF